MSITERHFNAKNVITINQARTIMSLMRDGWTSEEFAKELSTLVKTKPMSVAKFSAEIGVKRQTVYKWTKGDNLSIENLTKVINYFPSLMRLLDKTIAFAVANVAPLSKTKVRVPLIDQANAGPGLTVADPYAMGDAEDLLEVDFEVSQDAFALRLRGDSMEPDFHEGDVVIIDPSKTPNQGSFVVVELQEPIEAPGPGQWTFKQYWPRGASASGAAAYDLRPLNPEYPTITVNPSNPGRLVGTLVEHRKRYS